MTWDHVGMLLCAEAGILTLVVSAYALVRLAMSALDRKDLGARVLELESAQSILETRYARLSRGRRPVEALPATEPAPASPSLQGQAPITEAERRRAIFQQLRGANGGRS